MALIKCVECGKEVSSKASICPNCGCPISESISENYKLIDSCCNINGKVYDLSPFIDMCSENFPSYWGKITKLTNLSMGSSFNLAKQILETHQIPKEFNGETRDYVPPTIVTCPYCNSSNVKKLSDVSRLGSTLAFGIGSKKIGKQWHCNNCKSDF